jgi:superfamily I DNA/RNA helicase/RecB family exonuclease
VADVRLSVAQAAVVEHGNAALVVAGGPGTGKTTALVHRYLRLAAELGAGRVLVLCRSRAAVARFGDMVLPRMGGGFDSLPVTTPWGLAYDRLQRTGATPRLLSTGDQRDVVTRLLHNEANRADLWPTLDGYVGQPAFAAEVASTLLDLQAELAEPQDVLAGAEAAGVADRWRELLAFAPRYAAELDAHGWVDGAGLLARAVTLGPELDRGRFAAVLVDDLDAAGTAAARLVAQLAAAIPTVVAGDPDADLDGRLGAVAAGAAVIALDEPFRRARPPALVRVPHPALEPEAVAGALLAARADGVAWGEMAVLTRGAERGQAVARALARNDIPVTRPPTAVVDAPAVRAVQDLLDLAQGDGSAAERLRGSPIAEVADPVALAATLADLVPVTDPVALAHVAFERGLGHLVHPPEHPEVVADERALDAVVAWLGALERRTDPGAEPDPWVADVAGPDRVTVTTNDAAAGREWRLVVVAGCLEGELPRVRTGRRFFDRALLAGPEAPLPDVPARRARSLAEERRRFHTAVTRATESTLCTAAPEPGVLVSRFVGTLPETDVTWPPPPPPAPPGPGETENAVPVFPDGVLTLSATQLDIYSDCPLRYAYRYGAGAQDDGSVYADLGSLVHDVLERFLDPERAEPRLAERLFEIADECWRDDIAAYRPQLEEARRDYIDMLTLWWEKEGSLTSGGPEVLATEREFDIAVGAHRVRGRIDRVDRADDGVGIRVVDYKTGRRMVRVEDMPDDLQLATYHLAATRDPALAAWGTPTQLRLLYLRRMEARDQEIRPDHAEVTEARILATAEHIVAESFEPSVHADCDHCDFHRLCPLWPEGREVGEA